MVVSGFASEAAFARTLPRVLADVRVDAKHARMAPPGTCVRSVPHVVDRIRILYRSRTAHLFVSIGRQVPFRSEGCSFFDPTCIVPNSILARTCPTEHTSPTHRPTVSPSRSIPRRGSTLLPRPAMHEISGGSSIRSDPVETIARVRRGPVLPVSPLNTGSIDGVLFIQLGLTYVNQTK